MRPGKGGGVWTNGVEVCLGIRFLPLVSEVIGSTLAWLTPDGNKAERAVETISKTRKMPLANDASAVRPNPLHDRAVCIVQYQYMKTYFAARKRM